MKILEWLGCGDVGESSKAIALSALGEMPKRPAYPCDIGDFGRCFRLLELCPDARKGLEHLGIYGGDVWKALVAQWPKLENAYLHDLELSEKGDRDYKKYKCTDLLRSIRVPIEDASGRVIRTKHGSIHF